MTPEFERQIIRLASDSTVISSDARDWLAGQGARAAPALAEALDAERLGSSAQTRMLLLLAEIAAPETLPSVLAAFERALARQDPVLMAGALQGLSAFRTEESIGALCRALEAPDSNTRKHAAIMLGGMREPLAARPLARLLSSGEQGVRFTAVQALIEIGSAEAMDAVRAHAPHETDSEIRSLMTNAGVLP
jgi:HEAT repeat protein